MSVDSDISSIGNALLPLAENAILAYLTAQAPWTASPWISWLVKLIVNGVIGILFTKTEFVIYCLAITGTVNGQNDDFKKAVAANQANPTPENKAALLAAAQALISLNSP